MDEPKSVAARLAPPSSIEGVRALAAEFVAKLEPDDINSYAELIFVLENSLEKAREMRHLDHLAAMGNSVPA
jgi:hypothetical protein